VFYTFLGIHRDIICNFWINRTLDIDFTRFRSFLPFKFCFEIGFIEVCHVVNSDWPAPLRVDHGFALLDLRTVGWIRSSDTPSTSDLFYADGSGSNGAEEKEGELTAGSTPARFGGSGFDDEAAPVVSGEDELHDGIRGA
jgi:hypothetical protein